MNSGMARRYLSLHVFLSDPGQTERYLQERLEPAIQRWRAEQMLDRWFFIRYWEGGPHLRIRLAGPIVEDGEQAVAVLADGIADFCAEHPPTRDIYYREHTFDGDPVVVEELPWYAEGTVTNIVYRPELLRYGGEHAIGASEQLFELASRLALSLCKATGGNRNARLSSAFALMAAAVLACQEALPALGAYFQQYGAVWESRIGGAALELVPQQPSEEQLQLLLRLEQEAAVGWGGGSAHAIWASGVRQFAERMRSLHEHGQLVAPFDGRVTVGEDMCRSAVLGIVGSHIHMLNNRLGVPPVGEFLLARMLVRAVNRLREQDAVT